MGVEGRLRSEGSHVQRGGWGGGVGECEGRTGEAWWERWGRRGERLPVKRRGGGEVGTNGGVRVQGRERGGEGRALFRTLAGGYFYAPEKRGRGEVSGMRSFWRE
jgi:hypothetical protein